MKKTSTIKKNFEFHRAYKRGKSVAGRLLVVYAAKNRLGENRLGLTVSKKIGGAVQRNRAKRVMREAYRRLEPRVLPGFDVVLVARTRCVYSTSAEVCAELESALSAISAID